MLEETKETPMLQRTKKMPKVDLKNNSQSWYSSSAVSDFISEDIDETPSNTATNHRNSMQQDHKVSLSHS